MLLAMESKMKMMMIMIKMKNKKMMKMMREKKRKLTMMIVNFYIEVKDMGHLVQVEKAIHEAGAAFYDKTRLDEYCQNPTFCSLETIEADIECK